MENQDLYATHLYVLEKILNMIPEPNLCIEFGMGNFSTELLINRCKKLISVEMQSEEWFNEMIGKFHNFENWQYHLSLGPDAYVNLELPNCDLAFVDGHGGSRPECINLMMKNGCPIIVAHDTEEASYGWWRVEDFNYKKIDFKKSVNWTSVWVLDDILYTSLSQYQ